MTAFRLALARIVAPHFRKRTGIERRVFVMNASGKIVRVVTTAQLREALLRKENLEFSTDRAEWRECPTCCFAFVAQRKNAKYCSDTCRAKARLALLSASERAKRNAEWHARRSPAQRAAKAKRERERYARRKGLFL